VRPEIEYRIMVEQPVHGILNEVQGDVEQLAGVTNEEFLRAVYFWAMEKLSSGPMPKWVMPDLDRLSQSAPGTIEGETG
jgi:hypothetical protein